MSKVLNRHNGTEKLWTLVDLAWGQASPSFKRIDEIDWTFKDQGGWDTRLQKAWVWP